MHQPIPPAVVTPINAMGESMMGRILLDMGRIKPEDAEHILRRQKEKGMRFGEAAQSLGLITDADIQLALARQFDYSYLQPGQGNFASELVAAYEPFSAKVESLRALRSQLILRWFAGGQKSLAVFGIDNSNGVGLLAANLAIVFSQLGERTLLIDANLRANHEPDFFNIGRKVGLSDILADRADFSAICTIDSFLSLSVLPSGTCPPNPQELLSRPKFASIKSKTEALFEVNLYVAPALSVSADALSVAARAGGVLLVAHKNKTRITNIKAAGEQVIRSGATIVGSVIIED
jgi:protein-tyrosine kinase